MADPADGADAIALTENVGVKRNSQFDNSQRQASKKTLCLFGLL
jgi:hypothetical protein